MNDSVHPSAPMVKFNFRGDELDVLPEDGRAWVVVRRVCEALGVTYQGQIDKLKTDPAVGVRMILIPTEGGAQEAACLDVEMLPLWLATIHPSKVRPEICEKLIAYKREAARVLADHFLGRRGEVSPEIARALGAIPLLMARVEELEGKLAASGYPGIGAGAAKLYVLDNLREVAALQARVLRHDSPRTARSLRFAADRQLREWVGFPMASGARWERFPRERLGELCLAVARLRGEAQRFARAATPARQGSLRLVRA